MSSPTPFAGFFDYLAVINLPSRPDRLRSVRAEVAALGIAPERLDVPEAPVMDDDGGFPSRGVYGNFLSHIGILKEGARRGARNVLVLEDDAIFSRRARDPRAQALALEQLSGLDWGLWHLGHGIEGARRPAQKGVVPSTEGFVGAHAYCVNGGAALDELIGWLETVAGREAGHPDGGRMYIDGALNHYRQTGASKACVISNPTLSIQKGSDSDLGVPKHHVFRHAGKGAIATLRWCRDEIWRWTDVAFRP